MLSWIFLTASVFAVLFALVAVAHRSPIINVLSLVMMFFCMAVVFALIGMDFLAAVQIIVYSGAVLVLFLFVIMLLNLKKAEGLGKGGRPLQFALGAIAAIAAGTGLVIAASRLDSTFGASLPGSEAGTAFPIGEALVGSHLFAFEFISFLLVAAIIGAIYLSRREA